MADAPTIKLAYQAQLRRVRVELPGAVCLAQDAPPADLLLRASRKLESEKDSGTVSTYQLYEERLNLVWRAVREKKEDPNQLVYVTVGQGAPVLNGVTLAKAEDDKSFGLLTIKASADESRLWLPEWLEVEILEQAQILGITGEPHFGQIHGALWRHQQGELVNELTLSFKPPLEKLDKGYKISANRNRKEVYVTITDPGFLITESAVEKILQIAGEAVAKLAKTGDVFEVRRTELMRDVKRAMRGHQRYGFELPLLLLAATGINKDEDIEDISAAIKPPKTPPKINVPFEVSDDRMQVMVGEFDITIYENPEFKPNIDWLKNEVKKANLQFGLDEKGLNDVVKAMTEKKEVKGSIIAKGKNAVGASGAYLHPVYKERANVDTGDVINIRDAQMKSVVDEGDLVAELRYRKQPIPGCDVYGADIPPPPPEEFNVTMGEGIVEREPGKYFAAVNGIPHIEGGSISVATSYMHRGDINLKSGNLYFDGNAVVEGSIENGATVIVAGDLVVKGSIGAALVKAKGSISVGQGIVTTEKGRVQSNGAIIAGFIDNSSIVAGGNVSAGRSILNSQVVSGGAIETSEAGIIAGGEISCREFIRTGKLGFPKGAKTICHVGIDWKLEIKVRILTSRLARLSRKEADDRLVMRELARKNKAQMTGKHQEMVADVQMKLKRLKALIEKVTEKLENAKSSIVWDKEARIYVHGNLVPNVELEVGGVAVPVRQEVVAVVVASKRSKGSYISAIEETDAGTKAS